MSFFEILFGKKPSPYPPENYMPDYNYHTNPKSLDRTDQDVSRAENSSCSMPPLIIPDQKDSGFASESKKGPSKSLTESLVDSEHISYSSWAQANDKDIPTVDVISSAKPNIPDNPNIAKTDVESLSPASGSNLRDGLYERGYGHNARPCDWEVGRKPHHRKSISPVIPQRDVFAFVVENSNDTFNHKENIVNIISQIVENKKDAIFLFVKVGNVQTPFTPMDYKSVKEKNIISSLVSQSDGNELPNLASALFYLVNNLNVFAADTFSFDKAKYKLGNCSIVCIGTGACIENDESLKIVSSCISKLQNISKLKAFKYFCIKDSDAIRVATLGFPVIGHIVSDFYDE